MKEAPVEGRLRTKLESRGFKVLKLVTPGNTGTPDRMILRPTWSPGPPWFVELKRPGKEPTRQQELIAQNWICRGAKVLPFIDSYERVDETVKYLLEQCNETAVS